MIWLSNLLTLAYLMNVITEKCRAHLIRCIRLFCFYFFLLLGRLLDSDATSIIRTVVSVSPLKLYWFASICVCWYPQSHALLLNIIYVMSVLKAVRSICCMFLIVLTLNKTFWFCFDLIWQWYTYQIMCMSFNSSWQVPLVEQEQLNNPSGAYEFIPGLVGFVWLRLNI